jgi:integral membrane protein
MSDKSTATMKRLLNVGFGEGVSFLILLGIAMPLKYLAGMPLPVRIVGMLHGVLFIWYVIALIQAKSSTNLSFNKAIIAFLLSFLPFGTFFLKRLLQD